MSSSKPSLALEKPVKERKGACLVSTTEKKNTATKDKKLIDLEVTELKAENAPVVASNHVVAGEKVASFTTLAAISTISGQPIPPQRTTSPVEKTQQRTLLSLLTSLSLAPSSVADAKIDQDPFEAVMGNERIELVNKERFERVGGSKAS